MDIAENTDVLFIIGTSGATTLPHRIFKTALLNRAAIVVIDIASNIFSEVIEEEYEVGYVYREASGIVLEEIKQIIKELM
jgi:NAD-dependent deacetylase